MSKLVLSDAPQTGYNASLTEDEVETIVSLKKDEGLNSDEIAERVGRSRATVVRYLSRNGLSSRSPRSKKLQLTDTQFALIHAMKDEGQLSSDVSERTRIPLDELNRAYGAPSYDYYINHR